jgi:AAHS family benzoate transporter-like MFS transporter
MTEYSPRRLRATLVTLMFSGYAVGGMLAAVLGNGLIESHGWQSVFLAAALPVVLIPVILKSLPESMPFLLKRGRHDELKAILGKLDPLLKPTAADRFVLPPVEQAASAPVRHLFQDGRSFSTVMFWVAFFMCLFMVYALSSWLTKLMAGAGYTLGSALTFVLTLNFGGMLGAIGGGWLADRFNIKWVLFSMYLLAAVSITLLGVPMPTDALFVVVGLAGASTIGTQIVTYAYAGQFYPMAIRSTGIGFASGVGRSGAILAPIVIGMLVAMALPLQLNFVAIAVPAALAALAVAMIQHGRSATVQATAVRNAGATGPAPLATAGGGAD